MAEEGFLERWSRRKRQAGSDEVLPSEPLPPPAARPASPEPEPDPELLARLPRLEELTSDSDIRAFLDQAVPKPLRDAALRRAWSLDPVIRDYVGPADYAWDFNLPEAAGGFGPLSASDDVGAMVRRVFGDGVEAGPDRAVQALPGEASTALSAPSPTEGEGGGEGARPPAGERGVAASHQGERQDPLPGPPPPGAEEREQLRVLRSADGSAARKGVGKSGSPVRRRHGGAMPR